MIRYRALGDAGEMGASAHLVTVDGAALVLDAGLHPRHRRLPDYGPAQAASPLAIVLSHAHMDHVGSLPVARRLLPRARIYCTQTTRSLARVALRHHVERDRGYAATTGLLYSRDEVESLTFEDVAYETPHALADGLTHLTLFDAGHLPGSAGLLIERQGRRLFYTGDTHLVDRAYQLGARLPEAPVDVLMLESTQGANAALDGVEQGDLVSTLIEEVDKCLKIGGRVLLPIFAFGRAQEIQALLARAMLSGALPVVPVFVSGLPAHVSRICDGHASRIRRVLPHVRFDAMSTQSFEDGQGHAPPPGPCILLAGSGMLSDGSLSARLARSLEGDPKNSIIFVGYVDPDTPGHALKAGDREVAARLVSIPFSAHARRADLVEIVRRLRPRHVVLVHGDETARLALGSLIGAVMPEVKIHRPAPAQTLSIALSAGP